MIFPLLTSRFLYLHFVFTLSFLRSTFSLVRFARFSPKELMLVSEKFGWIEALTNGLTKPEG